MIKIIFLNGPPYSGKDTAAKLLSEINPQAMRFSFADELKAMFCRAHGFASFPEGKEKDMPMPAPFQDKTWRQGVIAFSEAYMKPLFGKDIFGKLLLKHIQGVFGFAHGYLTDREPLGIVCISDSGFSEEGQVLTQVFGKKNCCLVQLSRPGTSFVGDSRSYLTQEDIGADFTLFIANNGSLAHLKSELNVLAKWMATP